MVARLRGRSLDELRVRSLQRLYIGLERLSDRMALPTRPAGRAAAPDPFSSHLPRLVAHGEDPASVARRVAQEDPETATHFAQQADALEHGHLTLLGHESLPVGNPPRWHREALSGTDAPRIHWSRIDHLDTAVVGDHKLLWELNRHQYLLAPAFCWLLDRQARRFDLIQRHLESWLAENPPRVGVNWVSSLELAYRSISWCWLLSMLRSAPWRPDLRQRLAASLAAHARHIERYLSTYFSPNTHLTGEALGLFYVGTLLRPSAETQRWRARGAAILESQLERQVYPDGVYFEQASQYQRYTADIYLHYLLLAQASGWRVADATRERLAELCLVLRTMASGPGIIPLLGDDDGGLLLPLDHRPPDDVRGLLLAAGVALGRPELSIGAQAPASPAYWLCGIEMTERARHDSGAAPAWRDVYFACGGLAVLRDGWDAGTSVATIDAGPHGALSCGHSHADALSMTLTLGATALLIDRGTLTYTGPERNEFRATLSHNTLEIDGASSVAPGAPFRWLPPIPRRAWGSVAVAEGFTGFLGLASGHGAGGKPSAHCRRVLHQHGGAWLIHDRGVRAQAAGGRLRWQLAPGLCATALDALTVAVRDRTGAGIATLVMQAGRVGTRVGAARSGSIRIVTRDVSPRLGRRMAAQCLELPLDASLEALTLIVPAAADGALRPIELRPAGVAWSDAGGTHRVCVRSCEGLPPLPEGLAGEADLLWWVEGTLEGEAPRLAAMRAWVPEIAPDAEVLTNAVGESGTIMLWTQASGGWRRLCTLRPQRG